MSNQLTWDGDNSVGEEVVPTKVDRGIFEDLNARDWTDKQLPLIKAIWEQYKVSVDNFWYQVNTYGDRDDITVSSDANGLVWACGQVYGTARVLIAAMPHGYNRKWAIPAEVQLVAGNYQV